MKTILIDPVEKSVTEVEHDGDYRDIKRLLGITTPIDSRGIEGVPHEVVFFDDEFLVHDDGEPHWYFHLYGVHSYVGGRGLIVRINDAGDSVATKLTVADVLPNVEFKRLRIKGYTPPTTDEYDHPVLGKTKRVVCAMPIFEEVPDA